MRSIAVAVLLGVALAVGGCSTGYQASAIRGGYSETRMSADSYQVRYDGNAFVGRNEASQYLLRRCAELTLEHGKRYFTLLPQGQTVMEKGKPRNEAIVTTLPNNDDGKAFDAVLVVEETNEVADERLSPVARQNFERFKLESQTPPSPR